MRHGTEHRHATGLMELIPHFQLVTCTKPALPEHSNVSHQGRSMLFNYLMNVSFNG